MSGLTCCLICFFRLFKQYLIHKTCYQYHILHAQSLQSFHKNLTYSLVINPSSSGRRVVCSIYTPIRDLARMDTGFTSLWLNSKTIILTTSLSRYLALWAHQSTKQLKHGQTGITWFVKTMNITKLNYHHLNHRDAQRMAPGSTHNYSHSSHVSDP